MVENTIRAVLQEFIQSPPNGPVPPKLSLESVNASPDGDRVLNIEMVRAFIPYSKVHLRRMWETGKFPKPFKVGVNRLAWMQSEVEGWFKIASRSAVHRTPRRWRDPKKVSGGASGSASPQSGGVSHEHSRCRFYIHHDETSCKDLRFAAKPNLRQYLTVDLIDDDIEQTYTKTIETMEGPWTAEIQPRPKGVGWALHQEFKDHTVWRRPMMRRRTPPTIIGEIVKVNQRHRLTSPCRFKDRGGKDKN
jgi:predicted DNA-binding transcriptional regulator AlpA